MISALLIILFLVLLLLRVPVAISILAATVIAMLAGGYNLVMIPQAMAATTKSVTLMAVPFFILAANLMNAFGITQRIFEFASALVGFLRGGLAQVNVVASMIFAGISGAAVADAAGLGTVEIRAMRDAGYDKQFSAAVTLASSTIGPIIPPSIMMLVYAVTANVSPAEIFLAGVLPGLLIGLVLMGTIWFQVRTGRQSTPPPVPFSWKRLALSAKDGVLALITPVIILWGMVGGVVTPTEAGVLAVGYSIVLGLAFRAIRIKELVDAFLSTVRTSALILFMIAVSEALSKILVSEGIASQITELIGGLSTSYVVTILIVNLCILALGCVLETLPALILATTVLLPVIDALGVDRVHFGIIIIFNLLIGIMTPPMGIGLYILSAISDVRIGALVRTVWPYFLTLCVALLIITFFPPLTLALPELLLR